MVETTLTESDEDDITIVEVDNDGNPIGGSPPPAEPEAKAEPADEDADHDDDEGDTDARLGDNEEDNEDTTERNRRLREQRKQRREAAKLRSEREREELRLMREQNAALQQRMQQLEAATLGTGVNTLQQQREKLMQDIRMAEDIRAAAISAANGEDVNRAESIRDQLRSEVYQLDQRIRELDTARQQAVQPRADPNVANLAQQWVQANPWYDPQGRDADSATAKAIDAALVAEGFNPATRSYWQELTRRCADAFGEGAEAEKPAQKPAQKGPPLGTTSEHAPVSTRKNEIRVTPERKQAMIEAGVWDDPTLRNRYLKAYREYDNQSKAN